MPQRPLPEKSAPYFTLLETLSKPGCAICHVIDAASANHLDALYYELVTDVGVRRKLRQARGLCRVHAARAREMTSAALGIAIVTKDLLEEECVRLGALQHRPFWKRMGDVAQPRLSRQGLLAYVRGWRRRGICPVCQVATEHERHALETALNFFSEEEFAHRFEASGGMCVPHLLCAAERHSAHPGLGPLLATQRRLYARLIAELDEFCRKHDYRFTQEVWGAEADAWRRALQLLAGQSTHVGGGASRRSSRLRWTLLRNLRAWWR